VYLAPGEIAALSTQQHDLITDLHSISQSVEVGERMGSQGRETPEAGRN
jgi:hypothetical protein